MRYIETSHHQAPQFAVRTIEIIEDGAWIDLNTDGRVVGIEADDTLNDTAVLVALAEWVEVDQ